MNKINLIVLLCIAVSLLSWYSEREDLVADYLAFSEENLLKGRVWTLITALFVHADAMHLLGNMLFLFVFGNTVENELKAKKTMWIFFTGGILTLLLGTFFYEPSTLLVGASAAIFTLTAVVMLVKPLKFSFIFLMPQGLVAIIYFTYNVFAVYFNVQGNVAYVSHVIGFLIGIPFGVAWGKGWVKNLLIAAGLFLIYILIMFLLVPYVLQLLS